MTGIKRLLLILTAAISLTAPTVSQAQFLQTDADTYIYNGERDFEAELSPGEAPRVSVRALIDLPIAFYVVYSANRFGYAILGSFQCNAEFTLLKTHSNGLRDIRCVNDNVFNESKTYIIKYDGTHYIQIF